MWSREEKRTRKTERRDKKTFVFFLSLWFSSPGEKGMSLEFGIEFSCPVRRRISEQQLRELSRIASLNARFVDLSNRSESPPTKDMMRFMERSCQELSRIEEIMPICRQCPANFVNSFPESEGETIGCLGR